MVRLLLQLLALVALLLASLPATAAAAPRQAAADAAGAKHCEQTDAGASHGDSDDRQEDAQHPCCKNSMSYCCAVAAPMSGSVPPSGLEATKVGHRARAEIFVLGASVPPLMEPPTFA